MKTIDADLDLLRTWPLPDLSDGESKEDRGRVLIVGGSREIPGAALLAAYASLRSGAGKLHVALPEPAAVGLALALPEARVTALLTTPRGEIAAADDDILAAASACDALLAGPGMAATDTSRRVAAQLVARAAASVLDAGALGAATDGRLVVVTPHFGEMAQLANCAKEEVARNPAALARDYARDQNVIVALKSATTYVVSPDGVVWKHHGGTIGLGTSGSGDVLAGVVAGLIAQGAQPDQAAVWGVVLHGAAGARLAERMGPLGFLAREIADELPLLRAPFLRSGR
jgi:ADP-dependent NAD(P)H-hydrate dehydratase